MSDESRNIGGALASTWVVHRADNLIDIGLMDDTDPDVPITEECSLDGIGHRTGQMIGRYMLIRQLGEGGFGTVWLAEQRVPIHREVAIKFIKPGMDSRQVISKFETESQTLAMMQHPNIASVLDAGATPQGLPFFVMELVRGEPITVYCDRQKLDVRSRLMLFSDVCNAVQHAHLKAVLHRDLKPSNILVEEVDDLPVPKVIDFGIAKAISPSSKPLRGDDTNVTYTLTGAVVGTPEYMSPEQAAGDPDVDTRSDTYALGAILYEMLTGQAPLADHKLHTLPLDRILHLIREVEPVKPSLAVIGDGASQFAGDRALARQSEPRKLSQELQGDLDQILLKALEKDRDRRYESAALLGDDVRKHLHDQPVSARAPTRAYVLRKLIRRNKTLFFSAALSSLAIIAALTSAIWGYIREQQALKKALQAECNARDADSKSQRVSLFLGNLFRDISLRNNATMTPGALRELLENANNRRINELQNQPETDKRVSINLAEAFLELDKLDSAEELYGNAIRRLEELGQLEGSEFADCLFWLAWCQLQRAERSAIKDAGSGPVELMKRCIDVRSRLASGDDVETIRSNALLASAYRQNRHPDMAEALLKSLDSGAFASKARASSAYGWILRERAIIHRLKGEYEQALHSLEDARKNLINSDPSSNHRLQVQADIHRLSCEVHMQAGDWESALESAQAELGERLDWLGWEDPSVLLRIAEIHERREAPNEAIASLKRTIPMAALAKRSDVHEQALHQLIGLLRERHDIDQSELISAIVELSSLLLSRHDESVARGVPAGEVLTEVSKLLDVSPQPAQSPSPHFGRVFALRASLMARKRDYAAARKELDMAVKLEPSDYRHWFRLAVLCLASGDSTAYEQVRQRLVSGLKSETRRDNIIWSMRAILLRPDPNHSIPWELCENLLRSQGFGAPPSSAVEEDWIPLLMGMTAYRLEHYGDAQTWFEYVQSAAKRSSDPSIPICNQLFMAMNSHHLRLDEEPRALVEAQTAFDEQFKRLEGTDSQPAFHDILSAKILREETELTVLGRAAPSR